MAIDLKQTAIEPDLPEIPPTRNTKAALRAALDDMQGNILKSHGRNRSRHLFLTFKTSSAGDRKKAREWLAKMVDSKRIASALTQWESAKTYQDAQETIRGNGTFSLGDTAALLMSASGVFVGLMLSAAAYRDLKLGKALMPDDPSFAAGAKQRAAVLNDPPAEKWEKTFQATLHALVIVADDDDTKRIEKLVKELKKELKAIGATVAEETGTAMRLDEKGQQKSSAPVREHFGFVDGVSQPLFFARDIERAKTRHGGIDQYDPSAPLDQVLVKDPAGGASGYGSYVVYRKLEQDVQGFRDDELALATEIARLAHPKTPQATPDDIALAGAYMVGRFKDGTPVVDQQVPGLGSLPNNFSFDRDADGVRCPFQAHVRKTNPRGDKQRQFGVPVTQERTQRIARRAISYGPVTLKPGPNDKVGLLFLCAQSSIADQFEFIQAQWANNEVFLRSGSGLDPVIGTLPYDTRQNKATDRDKAVEQHWPKQYGSRNELDFAHHPPQVMDHFFKKRVGQWVTMRGGEYFFVPSLSALKKFGTFVEPSAGNGG